MDNRSTTPPMPPQHPPHVLAKMEKRKKLRKKLLYIAPVVVLVLVLGIWLGSGAGKANNNVLRSYTVLGNCNYQRNQIRSVTFLDTLADQPADAWDVSESGNGTVMAWVKPDGNRYDLYIAGEGGVSAGTSCERLFRGYENMTKITFGNSFDTANVQNMASMFGNCSSLNSLDLSSFDTTNVQDMIRMFYNCSSLTSLDLSSFDTANVQDMREMFYSCSSLTSLDLGDKFVTTNADTTDMFYDCPAW